MCGSEPEICGSRKLKLKSFTFGVKVEFKLDCELKGIKLGFFVNDTD